ncbi:MAG: sodium:proton antiporter [Ignavibacteriae bacterium]|nr:sodium:proton antiporter [Ignavibacteriota bacterium]
MLLQLILVIPFILLLANIAIAPFINEKWWHKNYPYVSYSLGAIILLYYLFSNQTGKLLISLEEYFSFITLLFSLYVVSGGIFFKIKGKATPLKNVLLLLFGSVIANIFGTTGAAMLLIRPYLNSNEYHLRPFHLVFFVFIVCNVGGSLTPIGDPPLFLGYIKGIPFFWVTENMFIFWLMSIFYLLTLFYFIDRNNYSKVEKIIKEEIEEKGEELNYGGFLNLIPLGIIISAVFITKPLFLREAIMLVTAVLSYKFTSKYIHETNRFNFRPIKEVAILFLGIFITMIPALQFLSEHSKSFGLENVGNYYWGCGMLTSFLDNAPAYLNFFAVAMAQQGLDINQHSDMLKFIISGNNYIVAISVSSVFFGAMTYIGNGPNFMVKSIAEHKLRKSKIPGFLNYLLYSLTILLPFYLLLWLLFFRG